MTKRNSIDIAGIITIIMLICSFLFFLFALIITGDKSFLDYAMISNLIIAFSGTIALTICFLIEINKIEKGMK